MKLARLYSLGVLGLLLLVNAAFNGWHGGGSPGPRYVSVVLPWFALWVFEGWTGFPLWRKTLLAGSLGVSAVFFVLVISTTLMAPFDQSIWAFYWGIFFSD